MEGEKDKLILETIKRFDIYINASNTKIAIILSYCIAYLAGLMLRLNGLHLQNTPHWLVGILLGSASLSSVITAWTVKYACSALAPKTPSGRAQHEHPSIFFFCDVADHIGGRDGYIKRVLDITPAELTQDLASQAHILANITKNKYKDISSAVNCLVYFQVPSLMLTVFVLIFASTLN